MGAYPAIADRHLCSRYRHSACQNTSQQTALCFLLFVEEAVEVQTSRAESAVSTAGNLIGKVALDWGHSVLLYEEPGQVSHGRTQLTRLLDGKRLKTTDVHRRGSPKSALGKLVLLQWIPPIGLHQAASTLSTLNEQHYA